MVHSRSAKLALHFEADPDDEPTDKVFGRLNRLSGLAGERDLGRIKRRVLENLDQLTALCLERQRTWTGKDGEERSYPDPDLKTALSAQLAGARILGVDEGATSPTDSDHVDVLLRKARKAIAAKDQTNGKDPTH